MPVLVLEAMIHAYHTIDARKRLYQFRLAGGGLERFVMQNRPRRAIFPFLALAATVPVAACALSAPSGRGLAPERLAQLQRICADTMQLTPGTTHFEDCMDVLSATARRVDQSRAQP